MKQKEVAIIDYGMGNIHSLRSALNYLGLNSQVTDKEKVILEASHIFLPGVGSYKKAMEIVKKKNLDIILRKAVLDLDIKLFGICLGMQLLGSYSDEDNGSEGLNLIPNKISKFEVDSSEFKIPHIGFNKIMINQACENSIFKDLKDESYFYFVHSHKMEISPTLEVSTTSFHGEKFISAFQESNISGTQFHPELSQSNGMKVLSNFLDS